MTIHGFWKIRSILWMFTQIMRLVYFLVFLTWKRMLNQWNKNWKTGIPGSLISYKPLLFWRLYGLKTVDLKLSGKVILFNDIFFKIQNLKSLNIGICHTKLQKNICILTTTQVLLITKMKLQVWKFYIFYPGSQLSNNKFSTKLARNLQRIFTNGGSKEVLLKKKRRKEVILTL